MKFVVEPAPEEKAGGRYITMCALCSEDPRFCPPIM